MGRDVTVGDDGGSILTPRRSFLGFLAGLVILTLPAPVWAALGKSVVATGYCPCRECCGRNSKMSGGHGLTASGHRPFEGVTVAADWEVFPAGTRLFIQNVGRRVVQDRGTDIVGPRIDIFFRNHAQAMRFGRRRVRVRVVA